MFLDLSQWLLVPWIISGGISVLWTIHPLWCAVCEITLQENDRSGANQECDNKSSALIGRLVSSWEKRDCFLNETEQLSDTKLYKFQGVNCQAVRLKMVQDC